MLTIHIILGSTRKVRKGEHIAKWVYNSIKTERDLRVELLDLHDYPLPFFEESITPSMMEGEYTNDTAKRWVKKIAEADAYIIVTPEYNHGYPAVLKNVIDYPYKQWHKKPVAFVSYGASAHGARAVEQLRLVVNELQMAAMREAIHIPLFPPIFDQQGNLTQGQYEKKLKNMLKQLTWWAKTLQHGRKEDGHGNAI